MSTNPLLQLSEFGQSAWCDYIHRRALNSGDIKKMVEAGEISGITSNPTIFEKAISESSDYDDAIAEWLQHFADRDTEELYEHLVVEDIQHAADLLKPVFDRTRGADGFVSVEVSPHLAYDAEGTILEARRLKSTIGRPNVMIKVPATQDGLIAIRALIGEGTNVNVTLMFSVEQYLDVVHAYLDGLEAFDAAGGDLSTVSSVASFFVSRIDTAVDDRLPEDSSLRGRVAIANARVAYSRFRAVVSEPRFHRLRERGARVQRVLWASTSVKNPDYHDLLYVDNLIGPDTINTMPPATLEAFRDHGRPRTTLSDNASESLELLAGLSGLGIDFDAVTRQLTRDGVDKFAKSYDSLMGTLATKRSTVEHTV